jgi:hypothetical protein
MKKKIVAKQGYRLTVNSWENDADNRRSETKDGLIYEEVAFYVNFAKLMYPKNGRGSKKGFGNLYEPDEKETGKLLSAFYEVIQKHKATAYRLLSIENDSELLDSDVMSDIFGEMHDELFGSGEFYTRVLDDLEVVFFAEDIEADEVTKEFL